MNYLAHIYLSGESIPLMIGNLIGDMIRNREVDHLPISFKQGILLHRFIDSFTDGHEAIREANTIFRKSQGKYAPVVTDIMMDHILAVKWNRWEEEPYSIYCSRMYDVIDDHYHSMPVHARKRIASMINGQWLHSYENEAGIRYAFSRLARRAKFSNRFDLAVDAYLQNREEINDLFFKFFPDIIQETTSFIEENVGEMGTSG